MQSKTDNPLDAEARRVLAQAGRFALWDMTAGSGGSLRLPVPWASSPGQSHLVTPERLAEILLEAAFAIAHWNDLIEPAENAVIEIYAGELPPLGLHVLVPDLRARAANLVRNFAGYPARIIQAVLTVAAPVAWQQPPNVQLAPAEATPPSSESTQARSVTHAITAATSGGV